MNIGQLGAVIWMANTIFEKLPEQYRRLKGYLIFSSPRGQCELTTNPRDLLTLFPGMVADSPQKEKAVELIHAIESQEREMHKDGKCDERRQALLEKAKGDLLAMGDNLELHGDTLVELRFEKPDLSSIFELQKNELFSQVHTPQTKSSVRIVLGTLEELFHQSQLIR